MVWHVNCRPVSAVVKEERVNNLQSNARGRGRLHLTRGEIVGKDMGVCGLTKDIAFDRTKGRN